MTDISLAERKQSLLVQKNELEDERIELLDRKNELQDQLDEAHSAYVETGKGADPAWRLQTRSDLRELNAEYQALLKEVGDVNRQLKEIGIRDGKDQFRQAAKELVSNAVYLAILERAEELRAEEAA